MERLKRKPLQGITNIIRFNWHYYSIALILLAVLFSIKSFLPYYLNIAVTIIALLTILSIILSLIISYYIYDRSDLYSLNWLSTLTVNANKQIVNIHAGFDETSSLLAEKFPGSNLVVFDFYDPGKHTEISIKRARKAYPAFPGTKAINTNSIPLKTNTVDYIFLILSAHEIRNNEERIDFFRQLGRALRMNGSIILVEHQRDINNFIAYNIGAFHFLSEKTWKQTFAGADLSIDTEFKITPFISTYILKNCGTTS